MKKTVFYISLILSLILLINIISILTIDMDRLTGYGYGYLTGRIILFLVVMFIGYLTRKPILKKKTD